MIDAALFLTAGVIETSPASDGVRLEVGIEFICEERMRDVPMELNEIGRRCKDDELDGS